ELVVSEAAVKQHLANLYTKFDIGVDRTHRRTRLPTRPSSGARSPSQTCGARPTNRSAAAHLLLVCHRAGVVARDGGIAALEDCAVFGCPVEEEPADVVPELLEHLDLLLPLPLDVGDD